MKRVIAAAAVIVAAFGMAAQAQAHGEDNDRPGWQDRGWQDRGRQERGWHDNRSYGADRWRGRDSWHDRDAWRDRDDDRWGTPRYRDYDNRYPRYYSRPYYGYGSRYRYPPAYRHGGYVYYDDYDDCDGGDVAFFLSLPLRF